MSDILLTWRERGDDIVSYLKSALGRHVPVLVAYNMPPVLYPVVERYGRLSLEVAERGREDVLWGFNYWALMLDDDDRRYGCTLMLREAERLVLLHGGGLQSRFNHLWMIKEGQAK